MINLLSKSMSYAQKYKPKKRIVRGTLVELKKYCKGSNLPDRWIKQDGNGYYLKLNDKGNVHVR